MAVNQPVGWTWKTLWLTSRLFHMNVWSLANYPLYTFTLLMVANGTRPTSASLISSKKCCNPAIEHRNVQTELGVQCSHFASAIDGGTLRIQQLREPLLGGAPLCRQTLIGNCQLLIFFTCWYLSIIVSSPVHQLKKFGVLHRDLCQSYISNYTFWTKKSTTEVWHRNCQASSWDT